MYYCEQIDLEHEEVDEDNDKYAAFVHSVEVALGAGRFIGRGRLQGLLVGRVEGLDGFRSGL